MDLLPTFARLAGTAPPKGRIIDGKDIGPLLTEEKFGSSPHEAFYYYHMDQLQAVRSGPWKLYLPLKSKRARGKENGKPSPLLLFNLKDDLGEQKNVADANPEVIRRLTELAEQAREDLGDGERVGKNQRPAGREPKPTPRVLKAG
jgi:arylsulfatase A-like enzyme